MIKYLVFKQFLNELCDILVLCLPLNGITLDQHDSDNNNWMIQLADVFRAQFMSYCASNILL